jgi:hypothetical protein
MCFGNASRAIVNLLHDCCNRWYNHLNPDINKEPWSAEEDRLITEVCVLCCYWNCLRISQCD